MYDNINIISSEYHKLINAFCDVLMMNDFDPIPLVDLLDSLQAESSTFLEGLGVLASFSTDDSDEHICRVRSLMLAAFSTFYDIEAWCNFDDEDEQLLSKLTNPSQFRIKIDGVLREIDHQTTICHGWSRHAYLRDKLTGDTL